MLLFIHGTGATNSLWIPQIRGILSLEDHDFTDKYLLDLFTISLPGHPKDDRYFQLEDMVKIIEQAVIEKKEKQAELADKLIFSKNRSAVDVLKNPKVVLIGHSVGGVIALSYTFRNLNLVDKVILISCGFSFSKTAVNLLDTFYSNVVFKLSIRSMQSLFKLIKNIRLKTIVNICLENPERKGLKSSAKIAKEYRFDNVYRLLSLDEQLKFSQIPILGVGAGSDNLCPPSSLKKLANYLDEQDKLLSTKKIVIEEKAKVEFNNFEYMLYSGGHEPMDNHRIRFIRDVREFLGKV